MSSEKEQAEEIIRKAQVETGVKLDKRQEKKVKENLTSPKKMEKAVTKQKSVSDNFTSALLHFVPLVGGSLLGGLDVGVAAQEGALAASESQRKAGLEERKVALREGQEERRQTLTPYQEADIALRKGQAERSKEKLKFLQSEQERKEGQFKRSQSFRESKETVRKFEKIAKDFTSDKVVSNLRSRIQEVTAGRQLIEEAKENPIAASALPRTLARLSGEVGVLTDQDVKAFGGSKAIKDRLEQTAKELTTGLLSDTNREYMASLLEAMDKAAKSNLENQATSFAGRGAKTIDADPEELKSYLIQSELTSPVVEKPSQTAPATNVGKLIRHKSGKIFRVAEDGDTLIPVE